MLLRVLAVGYVVLRLTVTSRCCIETAAQIKLVFGVQASLDFSHAVF